MITCELGCQNLHYAAINNHLDCFIQFSVTEPVGEYILTAIAEHKYYSIIEYCLQQNFKYNDKFIGFIKSYNISDIYTYPLIQTIFNN